MHRVRNAAMVAAPALVALGASLIAPLRRPLGLRAVPGRRSDGAAPRRPASTRPPRGDRHHHHHDPAWRPQAGLSETGPESASSGGRGATGSGPIRTVLADDVFDLRFMFKLALERSGRFEVVAEAQNGQEAIELATEHQPDLLLLDVSMPVKDGLEALPYIRRAAPDTKVVLLSGFEADRLASSAFQGGAVGYLEKGIPPNELVETLVKIFDDPDSASGTIRRA